MGTRRRFLLRDNKDAVTPCPKCLQCTEFVCVSQQVAEDCCEVWIECVCGHDPHSTSDRLESVMGGCSRENIILAIPCWNDAIKRRKKDTAPAGADKGET